MPIWRILHGDLLDLKADGLLCSANAQLNLSGGVGGAFLLRYGPAMQTYLHDELGRQGLTFVGAGQAIVAPGCGSPYLAVAHAVAIDGFYDTTPELIQLAYRAALAGLTEAGCLTIAAACLGCGYGRCPPAMFAESVQPLLTTFWPTLESITLATTNAELFAAVQPLFTVS